MFTWEPADLCYKPACQCHINVPLLSAWGRSRCFWVHACLGGWELGIWRNNNYIQQKNWKKKWNLDKIWVNTSIKICRILYSPNSGDFSCPRQNFWLGRVCTMALCFPALCLGNCARKYSIFSLLLCFTQWMWTLWMLQKAYIFFILFSLPKIYLVACVTGILKNITDYSGLCVGSKDLTTHRLTESDPIAITTSRGSFPF